MHMFRSAFPYVGIAAVAAIIAASCTRGADPAFLGSAVVEVKTYQTGASVAGTIAAITKDEGDRMAAGELIAVIDTVPLRLKGRELVAAAAQLDAQISSRRADIASAQSDVDGLQREVNRITDLVAKGSAPSAQKDDLETKFTSAKLKLQSANQLLRSLNAQKELIAAQKAELEDQIGRCYIKAPAAGIVLTRYKNESEMAAPGQPIFDIGKFDSVQVDFFVPQAALASIKPGQAVRIRVDLLQDARKSTPQFTPAAVTWISESAEFSPKNIQTRESRNELVFKVRATAANAQGILKRGMPVEVWR
jgi:HlyD family secretion protein